MLSRQIHATEFVLALELREAGAEEIGYSILKLLRNAELSESIATKVGDATALVQRYHYLDYIRRDWSSK